MTPWDNPWIGHARLHLSACPVALPYPTRMAGGAGGGGKSWRLVAETLTGDVCQYRREDETDWTPRACCAWGVCVLLRDCSAAFLLPQRELRALCGVRVLDLSFGRERIPDEGHLT
jgi:hypothetical protein